MVSRASARETVVFECLWKHRLMQITTHSPGLAQDPYTVVWFSDVSGSLAVMG